MSANGPFERWWVAIQARMSEDVGGQPQVLQDGKQVRFFSDGAVGQYVNSAPPAMAYELVDDDYDKRGIGAQRGPGVDGPLWRCWTRVKLHVWGADNDQVHTMRVRLISAIHDEAGADNYRLEKGAWLSREVGSNGIAYVFIAAWAIPIPRVDTTTTTVVIQDFAPLGLEMKNPGDTLP